MSGSPRLAVVIPCYNYAAYVGRAITSVVKQRHPGVEIVVVDDGSTDRSWDVICREVAVSPEIVAVRVANGGALRACLVGLDKTTAPFVLFLDADDYLVPRSLAVILEKLDPDVAKLQFSLGRVDAAGQCIGAAVPTVPAYRDRVGLAREVLATGVYVSPPTSGNVFRRDLCELLREVDYDRFVDGVPVFAAPFYGDVVSLPHELGRYRIHGRNASNLGGVPSAASLAEDVRRFDATMIHLGRVIAERGGGRLPHPERLYVHCERTFCWHVAAGRRPPLGDLPKLFVLLARHPIPFKNRIAMAVFFGLATLMPSRRAKALLAYRFKPEGRSLSGFCKTAVFGSPPSSISGVRS